MQYTQNFSLRKPDLFEDADVRQLNSNADDIDNLLYRNRRISTGPEWDNTTQYNVGDLVVYEHVLYKCIESTIGAWDSTKWVTTHLTDEVITARGDFANQNIADEFDSTSTYKVGDYVIYEENLYKCTTAITVAGTWNSSNWTPCIITDEMGGGSAVVTKTAEGNPITFDDGASAPLVECVTQITGSQDLHGYDKPWVGGAGKNKLPMTVDGIKSINTRGTWSGNTYTMNGVTITILTDSAENVIGIKVHGLANDTVDFIPMDSYFALPANSYILNGCSNGSSSTYRLNLYKVVSDGNELITQSLNGDSPSFTLSGDENLHSHIYISQGVQVDTVIYPMIRLATVADSTFASYSNICPITAYTEGEIEVRGKNAIDNSSLVSGYIGNDGEIVNNSSYRTTPFKKIFGSNSYTLSLTRITTGAVGFTLNWFDDKQEYISKDSNNAVTLDRISLSAQAPNNARYVRCSFGADTYTTDWQLEDGSTATTYEPYVGTTHTTTYPSAIYRGSEDVVNGSVTVNRVKWTKNTSTMNNSENYPGWANSGISELLGHGINRGFTNVTMNIGDTYNVNTTGALDILFLPKEVYGLNQTEWKALAIDVEIIVELDTPTTSPVTPTNLPIKSLSGYNHIESSTGDMEIEYITEEYQPLVDLIEDNAVSDMTGATSSTDGTHGLVPAPEAGDEDKFLKGDGTWGEAGGNVVYSSTPKVVGKWIDGVTDVYEVTMVTNHVNPTGTDYSYFPDTFSKIISVTGSISGLIARSSRYYAPMGGWFKQSNDNINVDCSVYLGNFGTDNVRVYYAFHDQSTITPGGMSCDEQTIVVRYLR